MSFLKLTALLAAVCLALAGCQVSGELENQAYVLALGVDRLENGDLRLSARVPKVGKRSEPGGDGGGGSPYLTFSASGADWPRALEALQWATPRQINLSHIELLVVSQALAREEDFPALINVIAETPHLYTTARFAVCEGDARDFVDAQDTVLGSRMSAEMKATFKHYADQGYIPDSSFAEAYYAANSIYSDPVAVWASLEDPKSASGGVQSPMAPRYAGTALFRGGRLIDRLSLDQTRLLSLIRGSARAFPFDCGGRTYELTPDGAASKAVQLSQGGATLALELSLSLPENPCAEDAARIKTALESALRALIADGQRLGVDPFGFSEAAAGRFLTVRAWQESGWREQYAEAEIDVTVNLRGPG